MKLAYLVNQYPKISHSFIRRELRAVEKTFGTPITRISVRRVNEPLVDPADLEEAECTRVLLDDKPRLLRHSLGTLTRPRQLRDALEATFALGMRSDRGLARHFAYLAEAATLVQWLREEDVDHVHAHFGDNPAAVAMLANALGGPTFSFTAHGTETFDFPPFIGIADKIAAATFVVAVSEYGRSQLCRWSDPAHWHKIHVVHCGADSAFFDEPASIPEEPNMVCVARLSGEKGHLVLMDACKELQRRGVDFHLELVGDGELRGEIEAFLKQHGLTENVRLLGWGKGEDVRAALRRARALVLPSFMEGLPVVIMEAFAQGRPAIATHVSGIPELVRENVNGWLVPAGAAGPLADAMEAVAKATPERLREMGTAGAEAVREHHDATREAGRLSELFRRYVR